MLQQLLRILADRFVRYLIEQVRNAFLGSPLFKDISNPLLRDAGIQTILLMPPSPKRNFLLATKFTPTPMKPGV